MVKSAMKKPIIDKAEVSIDFPDKFYMGSFGRGSKLDVAADADGVHIHLERAGEQHRKAGFHLQYHLLVEVIEAVADEISAMPDGIEPHHAEQLSEAASRLQAAVMRPRSKTRPKK